MRPHRSISQLSRPAATKLELKFSPGRRAVGEVLRPMPTDGSNPLRAIVTAACASRTRASADCRSRLPASAASISACCVLSVNTARQSRAPSDGPGAVAPRYAAGTSVAGRR